MLLLFYVAIENDVLCIYFWICAVEYTLRPPSNLIPVLLQYEKTPEKCSKVLESHTLMSKEATCYL